VVYAEVELHSNLQMKLRHGDLEAVEGKIRMNGSAKVINGISHYERAE